MKKHYNNLTGIISISAKGTGYVKVLDRKDDIEIDFKHLNTALHGDVVEIVLHRKEKERMTGEVVKIISRAKMGFAGVLEEENKLFFLKPDDTKMYTDILIPKESLHGAKMGQKVFVEIVSWHDAQKAPLGKIIKVLGQPGDNDAEMRAIAVEKGFDTELPSPVEKEAEKIKREGIRESDYKGRRDFRKILTFTIDPSDAKDFDDAISFRELPSSDEEGAGGGNSKNHHLAFGIPPQKGGEDLYEVGIHIADVTHYVRPGSALDQEARERGTSVYLVDRTIPMLPEILSNDLCSLVPHQDRLTMSAVFVLDKNARVKSEWFGRTVIHSKKRFTYEEAEESIKKPSAAFHRELSVLNGLAKKMTKERFSRGAISLDQEEVKFVLDKDGVPIKVIKKERGDSNKLIEEFMLLANKRVAEILSPKNAKGIKSESASIYRVHDLPSREKMADLAFFLRSLGHKISLQEGIIPNHEINKLLESLTGKNEGDTVHRAVIRSMAKAIYSTKNIGHYGLAFPYYTHFTSPIRRYPDIMVHRLLGDYLANTRPNGRSLWPREKLQELEKISVISSEQEKRAAEAERASVKYKQVEYMGKRLGKSFEGIVSGITEWGMYVEEKETKCEGLVRVRDMNDDFYVFNEKKLELLGQKKKKRYRLGSCVKIKVKGVDLERKTIDYALE
ncbi:MAG: Ribonuclease R [Candidatus Nomurabacteria bacterium GW2011_GWF2_43_8]|uniref:Ribonuclease R n=2 Tax=Candidatus Nomuraibacteriota TaxID=1752729 RepID=A0A0G1FIE7_9BACT|nr:MAG: Ribonuclease R [Candidatus Nomurabacteria bacterium GW2011_GWF2_43_8]